MKSLFIIIAISAIVLIWLMPFTAAIYFHNALYVLTFPLWFPIAYFLSMVVVHVTELIFKN